MATIADIAAAEEARETLEWAASDIEFEVNKLEAHATKHSGIWDTTPQARELAKLAKVTETFEDHPANLIAYISGYGEISERIGDKPAHWAAQRAITLLIERCQNAGIATN